MNYISTKEASKKWNISSNRVFILARSGKIPNVVQVGSRWLIPEDAQKPVDGRTSLGKFKTDKNFFRYPIFEYKDASSFNPPLSEEELILKQSNEAFYACDFENAKSIIESHKIFKNKYLHIYSLYSNCMINIYSFDTEKFFENYNKLTLAMQGDFPHKQEMEQCLFLLDALLGTNKYYAHNFEIDPTYNYNSSFLPRLAQFCTIPLAFANTNLTLNDIKPFDFTFGKFRKLF